MDAEYIRAEQRRGRELNAQYANTNGPNAALVRPEARHLVTGERFGTAGRPKFLGVTQMKNGTVVAAWDDGSLAELRYEGARGRESWVRIASPDYDALFTETVRVETTPDD